MRFRDFEPPLSFFRSPSTLPDIPSSDALRRILERERARTERTGKEFAFVVFAPADGRPADGADLTWLAALLLRRIRATDVVGRFDGNSLGVVLPATAPAGAVKFAEDVCRGIPAGAPSPRFTVYAYPSEWISSDRPPGASPSGDSGNGQRAVRHAEGASGGKKDGAEGIHRMERIFGSPIPLWKRAMDVVGASVALALFSPLILLIAAWIKIVSPGPVFFKQERVGHMGKPFTLWKFRTMRPENDPAVHRRHLSELIRGEKPMEKLDAARDPRILSFGRILRQTCLDELPQLFNVLRGDMSLVGPRPCLPYEAKEYLPWHARRFDSTPGMTGLWQVNGKNRTTFREMIRFDIAYARRISPWMDFKILLKTAPAICMQLGDHVARKESGERKATGGGG
jgi:lipopolysaccharide/colanic/teichoic acid biosynthesis glycosyltransferase